MHKEHPVFHPPRRNNQPVWRYRPLDFFTSIIDTGTLYFSQAAEFGDDFEGTVPRGNVENRGHYAQQVRNHWENLQKKVDIDFVKEQVEQQTDAEVDREEIESWYSDETVEWVVEETRKEPMVGQGDGEQVFANCWHINDYESSIMWGAYIESNQGAVIQSTYEKLCESFDVYPDNHVFIGKVGYIDYTDPESMIPENNGLYPYVHKQIEYKEERELRATISYPEVESDHHLEGLSVDVDLDTLIEKVVLAPEASDETAQVVNEVMKRNGLAHIPVEESQLDATPIQWQ
ncbi:hypothetical protein [Haloferax sp. Atlit-47N]|uniref:hypothetical protein n=1 Tax=Haloferax sp. Atlit-47N TaxID=2077199 RepID=UPI0011C01849|nr:hypothetical protein [Haloferax sp. Atlit-47N]